VLSWVVFITPYAGDQSLSLLARLASVAYPACDVLLLTLLLRLLFAGPARHHTALMLLALSFALTLASDIGFAWASLQGTYASGHVLDVGWVLGFVLAMAAAVHPSARVVVPAERAAPAPLLPRSRFVLLAAASLVAPVLVVRTGAEQAKLELVVVGIASGVLFLLVLWRMAGLVRQISRQAAELDELSTTDALTGLATRRRSDPQLQTALARAQRSRQALTVVLLNLDKFKSFNDTFGHPAGDALLRKTAEGWQAQLRPGDLLARVGGEKFAALLIGCDSAEACTAVERIRAATPQGATCSAGIAALGRTESPTEVVARADAALYRAKAAGRDCIVVAPSWTAVATQEPSVPRR
jgi:diguanylate cyclase (GGDEF)-like protein